MHINSYEKRVLERFAKGRESEMIEQYIDEGPAQTKAAIGASDFEWQVVKDYLVFHYNLFFKVVACASDFFRESYVKFGMEHVREILDAGDAKYDRYMEQIFDYLAVAKEAICEHVLENREKYVIAIRARGSEFVRVILGILDEKYDETWLKILDVLLDPAVEAMSSEKAFENGVEKFGFLVSGGREHRALVKHDLARI